MRKEKTGAPCCSKKRQIHASVGFERFFLWEELKSPPIMGVSKAGKLDVMGADKVMA